MPYPQYQYDLNTTLKSEILEELIFLNIAKHAYSEEQRQKEIAKSR